MNDSDFCQAWCGQRHKICSLLMPHFSFFIAFVILKSNLNFMYANFALPLIKLVRGYYLTLDVKRFSRHHIAIIELLKMFSRDSSSFLFLPCLSEYNTSHQKFNIALFFMHLIIHPCFVSSHLFYAYSLSIFTITWNRLKLLMRK